MSNGVFCKDSTIFRAVTADSTGIVQDILDHAHYYHTTILHQSPAGLAERCFRAPLPAVSGSRVFRHLVTAEDRELPKSPAAVLDIFVGFPNYKIASIAMFVIREDCQRKGLGKRILTQTLPAFLREYHPAVETISVSLTENNVPAMRCLLACKYERTNRWEKYDVNGQPIIAVTFRHGIADLIAAKDN